MSRGNLATTVGVKEHAAYYISISSNVDSLSRVYRKGISWLFWWKIGLVVSLRTSYYKWNVAVYWDRKPCGCNAEKEIMSYFAPSCEVYGRLSGRSLQKVQCATVGSFKRLKFVQWTYREPDNLVCIQSKRNTRHLHLNTKYNSFGI